MYIHNTMLNRLTVITLCVLLSLSAKAAMPPPAVETTLAKQTLWQQTIHATGSLSADQGIMLTPEIAGRVTAIYFKSGALAKQGQLLVQINPDVIKAALKLHEAALTLRQIEDKRATYLYKEHVIAQADFDIAKANLATEEANVQQAQAQLNQTTIRAPFTGKLGLNEISVGDYVQIGQNIVSLQALDPMRVDFSVPEVYLNQLHVGQKVEIRSEAYPGQVFTGIVNAFDSVVNKDTRSLAARAMIPNHDNQLLPGTFAEVTLFLGTPQKVVIVPQTAIIPSPKGNAVYKVVNGKAVNTPVVLGPRNAVDIIIKQGLKPDEVIIATGGDKVQNGMPVMVIDAKKL